MGIAIFFPAINSSLLPQCLSGGRQRKALSQERTYHRPICRALALHGDRPRVVRRDFDPHEARIPSQNWKTRRTAQDEVVHNEAEGRKNYSRIVFSSVLHRISRKRTAARRRRGRKERGEEVGCKAGCEHQLHVNMAFYAHIQFVRDLFQRVDFS